MHAFVRFEVQADGLHAATISPAADVLPLVAPHFRDRFPSHPWLLFDERRAYGLLYDLTDVHAVEHAPDAAAPEEPLQQHLWRTYFHAVTIPERANRRLQLRHLPRRYHALLPEMQGRR